MALYEGFYSLHLNTVLRIGEIIRFSEGIGEIMLIAYFLSTIAFINPLEFGICFVWNLPESPLNSTEFNGLSGCGVYRDRTCDFMSVKHEDFFFYFLPISFDFSYIIQYQAIKNLKKSRPEQPKVLF